MEIFSHIDPSKIWTSLRELFLYDSQAPLLFNSGQFMLVFMCFFGGYLFLAPKKHIRTIYVILFSLFFYYKSSGFYFVLLLFSTVIDFYLGHWIHESTDKGKRKFYLILSIIANLGLLAYFKYTGFIADTINSVTGSNLEVWDIFLPVGISFYTFQTMSYSIDIYRRKLTPSKDILEFAFFVSFFPQLVAGPIVRAADFIPQIRRATQVSLEDIGRGFLLICAGLFKKAVISDYIGVNFVDRVFESPALYSGFENLMSVYAYALQIYCDFSGYSDIAIGIGLLLGFQLPINFRTPYQSATIQEFWRRWHISLSSWLRDYLYISLGGNRKGKWRTYLNLMITMLLGGLWHGASWKFVIWGALHGFALAIERYWMERKENFRGRWNEKVNFIDDWVMNNWIRSRKPFLVRLGRQYDKAGNTYWYVRNNYLPFYRKHLKRPFGIILTFHFVCFCWIFFRASSFEIALEMISQILYAFDTNIIWNFIVGYKKVVYLIILGFLLHFIPEDLDQKLEKAFINSPMIVQSLTLAIVIWFVIQAQSAGIQPFIYFQF